MKRPILLLILLVVCAAAVAAPRYLGARETARQQAVYVQRLASEPLVLGAKTKAILAGADRVETFRLQGPDEDYTASEQAMLSRAHPISLNNDTVIQVGPQQGRAFAGALQAALVQGTSEQDPAQCFMPGVGFRAWQGKAHTDICICFTCQGVEIVTKDAKQTVLHQSLTQLGASRPALLALSRQAFPQDAALASLK